MKRNTKSFFSYANDKTREELGPLQKGTRELLTQDKEKAEVLSPFFPPQSAPARALTTLPKVSKSENWGREKLPTVSEDQV